MMPKHCRPISQFPESCRWRRRWSCEARGRTAQPSRSAWSGIRWCRWSLCALLAVWLYYHFVVKRLSLDINSLNTTLLLLTLLLHRNVKRFAAAVQNGRRVELGGDRAVPPVRGRGGADSVHHMSARRLASMAASISHAATFPLHHGGGGIGIRVLHSVERRPVDGPGFRHGEDGDGGRGQRCSAGFSR